MRDPWKYLAFPSAAVAGYLISKTAVSVVVKESIGLSTFLSETAVVAVSGLLAGFLVDEVIPAYLEKVRGRGGGSDFGGDFDTGDMDFGE